MKARNTLLTLLLTLAASSSARADGTNQCLELCIHGEWIFDFFGDGAGASPGDVLTWDFTIGQVFKYDLGGLQQEYYVSDHTSGSYTLVDNGHNSAFGIDDNTPDGRIDPVWLMGDVDACTTIEVPDTAFFVTSWQQNTLNVYLNGNLVANPGVSIGTNPDANHIFQNGLQTSMTRVDCVPETSTSLLGLLGAGLLLRRRR